MECPYCLHEIEVARGRCPNCKRRLYDVTEEDFEDADEGFGARNGHEARNAGEARNVNEYDRVSLEEAIQSRFRCAKCGGEDCSVKEVAMTGTGLSKLFDIQHNHYLFVSCEQCGAVEIYDPEVLSGHKPGRLGTILDVLFGG